MRGCDAGAVVCSRVLNECVCVWVPGEQLVVSWDACDTLLCQHRWSAAVGCSFTRSCYVLLGSHTTGVCTPLLCRLLCASYMYLVSPCMHLINAAPLFTCDDNNNDANRPAQQDQMRQLLQESSPMQQQQQHPAPTAHHQQQQAAAGGQGWLGVLLLPAQRRQQCQRQPPSRLALWAARWRVLASS